MIMYPDTKVEDIALCSLLFVWGKTKVITYSNSITNENGHDKARLLCVSIDEKSNFGRYGCFRNRALRNPNDSIDLIKYCDDE